MARLRIGTVEEFNGNNVRKIISLKNKDICVLQSGGNYYAYENHCLHQGGPSCEGVIIGKVEAVLAEDRSCIGERFSDTETHFVCPWHSWEYDVATGECAADRRMKLKSYEVIAEGDEIYVVVGNEEFGG